jgi:hypothetical protein
MWTSPSSGEKENAVEKHGNHGFHDKLMVLNDG